MAVLVTVKMYCTNKLCENTQNVTRVEDIEFKNYDKHVCEKCGFKTLSPTPDIHAISEMINSGVMR